MPFELLFKMDVSTGIPGEMYAGGSRITTDNIEYAERLIRDGIAEPANDEAEQLAALIVKEAEVIAELKQVNGVDQANDLLARRREKVAEAEKLLATRKKQVLGE